MSWSGDFQIKYNGKYPNEFKKIAKMIIPNSIMRFDFDNCFTDENSVKLSCTRNLSWYSADKDMEKLISYFPNGDSVTMEIDGEGEYEIVEIKKVNGNVNLKSSNPKSERYRSPHLGVSEMIYENISPLYIHDDADELDICSLNGYIQLIANTFSDGESLMPIIQDFMYTTLDKNNVNCATDFIIEGRQISVDNWNKLENIREKFNSIESTSQFLKSIKRDDLTFKSNKCININDLPDWIKNYPKSIISSLGGAALIKELIEKRGEKFAEEFITFSANAIMQEQSMKEEDMNSDDEYSSNQRKI